MLNSTVKATKTVCQAFYQILRSIKTRFTQRRLFYTQGPFFCALGPLFCALVRDEAIFAVCKRCANEGFACMCKEKYNMPFGMDACIAAVRAYVSWVYGELDMRAFRHYLQPRFESPCTMLAMHARAHIHAGTRTSSFREPSVPCANMMTTVLLKSKILKTLYTVISPNKHIHRMFYQPTSLSYPNP